MSLKNYTLLIGKPTLFLAKKSRNESQHFQIQLEANNQKYRIAIDVWSEEYPHELKYIVIEDFQEPILENLLSLPIGKHLLDSRQDSLSLDYQRKPLFDFNKMEIAPKFDSQQHNFLDDLIQNYTQKTIDDPQATMYVFGESWGPSEDIPDKYFHFSPGQGIHDIHMNQGADSEFSPDNGIYQDGGIFFYFPDTQKWVGIFLAFQSQKLPTDDSGNPINTDEIDE